MNVRDQASSPKGTYFVCRSEYEHPRGHRVVRFEDPDLLGWFQNNWVSEEEAAKISAEVKADGYSDTAYELAAKTLGGSVYGADSVWEAMAKRKAGAPKKTKSLLKFLRKISYPEGGIGAQPGFVQAITDDDEINICWYLFDGEFATAHPEAVAFLLRDEWELPTEVSDVGLKLEIPRAQEVELGSGEGSVHAALLTSTDGVTLHDLNGAYRFDGTRLSGLIEALKAYEVISVKGRWGDRPSLPDEMILLRALALSEGTASLVAGAERIHSIESELDFDLERKLGAMRYQHERTDFLSAPGGALARDWKLLMGKGSGERRRGGRTIWKTEPQALVVQESDHCVQIRWLRKQVDRRGEFDPVTNVQHWILFDDLWAAANPDLAESILRYASRWDFVMEGE